ncbi:MAG TPA: transposase [Syntrophorhabdaceae bacterium]|jgi:REP element-mobilizing transposase RayT
MSRPLRIQFKDAYYHVTCRGNGRQSVFLSDQDRKKFLDLLERSLDIYQVNLLAFVLMTNHFHMMVTTPRANLQEFMRHFTISYTSYFNKRHQRSGHLYQGRYKSFLIETDSYLLEVSRYLHLNPIRIKQFSESSFEEKKAYLDKYPWSSYRDYLSSSRYDFLSRTDILSRFSTQSSYRDFVEEGIQGVVNPLERGQGHGIIGTAPFIKEILKMKMLSSSREQPEARRIIKEAGPDEVLAIIAKHFKITPEEVLEKRPAKSVAMEFLYRYAGMNQREIGELMGLDYSSISVARKRLREAAVKDKKLQRHMKVIEDGISQVKI